MSTTTNETDFDQIPPYEKRQFVPENADLSDIDQVLKLLQILADKEVKSISELEAWLRDRSELEMVMDQHSSLLYIRMTCQTDDKARAEAYKQYIETIVPAVKPWDDKLDRKYLELLEQFPLDEETYMIYNREIRADVELFVEENIELETKEDLLSQEYQTVCGAMTVQFQGEEKTLPHA